MIDISKVQYSDEWNNTVNGLYEKYYDFIDTATVKNGLICISQILIVL